MAEKSDAPGQGGRFQYLAEKLEKEGKSPEAAKGIAAQAGRAKYGKAKFQEFAAKGKQRAGK